MYYVYYNEDGTITAVANITDETFGPTYIEVDLPTYTKLSDVETMISHIVVENVRIKGKMYIVSKNADTAAQLYPKGIIPKQSFTDNAVIFKQSLSAGTWTVISTMNDEVCALFSQGDDYIKEYYVVDPTNRFIIYDTLSINLKKLASAGLIELKNYNKTLCKQNVSLLCGSQHVKHIHTVEE
jgi:DNA-binding beta-propeller fold protein YncE